MAAVIFRVVVLVALGLMPFSMGSAPAFAAPSVAAAAGHCGEHQKPKDAPAAPKAHCAACAALPAIEVLSAGLDLQPAMLLLVDAEQWIVEQGPETATPPPKLG